MNSFSNLLKVQYPDRDPNESQRLVLSNLYDKLTTTTSTYEQITLLEPFLDYFAEFADSKEAMKQLDLLRDLINTQIEILTEYEYLDDLIKCIVEKYELFELFLNKVLTYYRDVRYEGFVYSKFVRIISFC